MHEICICSWYWNRIWYVHAGTLPWEIRCCSNGLNVTCRVSEIAQVSVNFCAPHLLQKATRPLKEVQLFYDQLLMNMTAWSLMMQVLHEPDVDFRSTCNTFSSCLGRVAEWHSANPSHFPLTIFLNQKVSGLAEYLGDEGMNLLASVMKTSTTPGPNG